MDNTLHLMLIILIIIIGAIIVKYITLTYSTFIGSKAKIYVVWYKLISIGIHIAISIELLILSSVTPIAIAITVPYLIFTLYLGIKLNYEIYKTLLENKSTIIVISMIKASLVDTNRIKESTLKCLINNMEKVEFKITRRDANKIRKLLKNGATLSKVHYYRKSTRLYGIEVLQYN